MSHSLIIDFVRLSQWQIMLTLHDFHRKKPLPHVLSHCIHSFGNSLIKQLTALSLGSLLLFSQIYTAL